MVSFPSIALQQRRLFPAPPSGPRPSRLRFARPVEVPSSAVPSSIRLGANSDVATGLDSTPNGIKDTVFGGHALPAGTLSGETLDEAKTRASGASNTATDGADRPIEGSAGQATQSPINSRAPLDILASQGEVQQGVLPSSASLEDGESPQHTEARSSSAHVGGAETALLSASHVAEVSRMRTPPEHAFALVLDEGQEESPAETEVGTPTAAPAEDNIRVNHGESPGFDESSIIPFVSAAVPDIAAPSAGLLSPVPSHPLSPPSSTLEPTAQAPAISLSADSTLPPICNVSLPPGTQRLDSPDGTDLESPPVILDTHDFHISSCPPALPAPLFAALPKSNASDAVSLVSSSTKTIDPPSPPASASSTGIESTFAMNTSFSGTVPLSPFVGRAAPSPRSALKGARAAAGLPRPRAVVFKPRAENQIFSLDQPNYIEDEGQVLGQQMEEESDTAVKTERTSRVWRRAEEGTDNKTTSSSVVDVLQGLLDDEDDFRGGSGEGEEEEIDLSDLDDDSF